MLPWNNSNLFHPVLAPIPFCQAIVGRQGVKKLETIEALIQQNNISSQWEHRHHQQ